MSSDNKVPGSPGGTAARGTGAHGTAANAGQVILTDDEEHVRLACRQSLELEGFEVQCFANPERALERIRRGFEGVLVSDIKMPKKDGLQLLAEAREIDADLPVILITGHADVPLAVKAMQAGAYDFVEKPFAPSRLIDAVTRAMDRRRLVLENRALRSQLEKRDALETMLVGRAPVMVELRQRLRTIAGAEVDVLVLGETGTGKELAARALHELSERRERPFVAINMSALPAETIESELFGHEMGAFSGAHRARVGKFEHARGGTLFLDEIGSMPLALQTKLLRVIQERVIERLGSNEAIDLDVRFIASTKEDLGELVKAGQFRDDLYYRLNVVNLIMPPLRDRMGDAPRLFQHLVNEAALRYRREAPVVATTDMAELASRDWPGNVRELRNAADRFVLGLGIETAAGSGETSGSETAGGEAESRATASLAEQVEAHERRLIAAALARNGGNLKATYEALALSRKTLYEKMQKYGLRREDYSGD